MAVENRVVRSLVVSSYTAAAGGVRSWHKDGTSLGSITACAWRWSDESSLKLTALHLAIRDRVPDKLVHELNLFDKNCFLEVSVLPIDPQQPSEYELVSIDRLAEKEAGFSELSRDTFVDPVLGPLTFNSDSDVVGTFQWDNSSVEFALSLGETWICNSLNDCGFVFKNSRMINDLLNNFLDQVVSEGRFAVYLGSQSPTEILFRESIVLNSVLFFSHGRETEVTFEFVSSHTKFRDTSIECQSSISCLLSAELSSVNPVDLFNLECHANV